MNFTAWLFSNKELGETAAEVVQVFNKLSESQKEALQRQYELSLNIPTA